ncbi:MAG TPA: trigger factor [Anaeromyxobacteraceae bacterium]|nr:trigger factor [Anaeromyxobacteraceae bacterium]
MKIEVEAISPVEKKVTVEVDPERVAREVDRAYLDLGRRVKLRGFRAGKVPRSVLERHFRDEVERDVVQKLVSAGYGDAVREQDIEAVAPPHVDLGEGALKVKEPFRFTARVEVKPKLAPRDYRGLVATRPSAEVTDAMLAEELSRLQEGLSQLVPVEGRFDAQEGDYAVIDHEGTVAGEPFPGGKAEGVTVRVAPGEFVDGFISALAGRRLGERFETEVTFPAGYRVEALRGKVAHLAITVKALKSRQVPPLDDELAKDVGLEGIDTLEKLRARMREDLAKREQRRAEAETKESLLKAALQKNEFEVPPALIERAIDSMVEGAAERFGRQGLDIRKMGLDLPRLRANLREQALFRVKSTLILEAIADQEKIEVSEEEVQAEIARTASELKLPLSRVQHELRGGEPRAALRSRLREEKALAFLSSEAKLN